MPADPRRGEVWRVSLEPVRGAEMRKTRPAVVVGSDSMGRLPLRLIVPLTDWKDHYARAVWLVRVDPDDTNGLTKTSAADTLQIRGADIGRFGGKLGLLADADLERIVAAIALNVEYSPPVADAGP